MKRILFVDDEPQVLCGLKRMLYPFRNEWTMEFVQSGEQALQMLGESPYDVLVTDVRMPQMSGISLLSDVLRLHPDVLRIVLSGTADREMTLRSVELAHQYLTKPCEPKTLRAAIERALNIRQVLADASLRRAISSIRSLPSLPRIYQELMEAVKDADTPAAEIGAIVAQDPAMVAKVLQLVNSAFFGPKQAVVDPVAAATYLGYETIRSLALQGTIFMQFDRRQIPDFPLQALQQHSLRVATRAKQIADNAGLARITANECMAGGLLHDVGKLVLACCYPDQYRKVLQQVREHSISARTAELDIFGTTHTEAGAYLLWLWGLPDVLTEIVALHHTPPSAGILNPTAAVYIADTLDSDTPHEEDQVRCLELARETGRSWDELTKAL